MEQWDNSVLLWHFLEDPRIFREPARAFLQGCKSRGRAQRLLAGLCTAHAVVIWPGQGWWRGLAALHGEHAGVAQHSDTEAPSMVLFTASERKQEACGNISQAGGLSKLVNLH